MKLKLFEFPIDPRYKDIARGNVTYYVLSRGNMIPNDTALSEALHFLEKDCYDYYGVVIPEKEMDTESGIGKEIYDRMLANRWHIMCVNHETNKTTYWLPYYPELWNDVDNVSPITAEEIKQIEFYNNLNNENY